MSPDPAVAATEFAWRTHSAITDWTAKVDAKASIVLALESAIMGAVITFSGRDRPLSALQGWPLGSYRLGSLLMGIGHTEANTDLHGLSARAEAGRHRRSDRRIGGSEDVVPYPCDLDRARHVGHGSRR